MFPKLSILRSDIFLLKCRQSIMFSRNLSNVNFHSFLPAVVRFSDILQGHQGNIWTKPGLLLPWIRKALQCNISTHWNVLISRIGRKPSWYPNISIYWNISKQMYLYLSLVERKVAEFSHNMDKRHYSVWIKLANFHHYLERIHGVLGQALFAPGAQW